MSEEWDVMESPELKNPDIRTCAELRSVLAVPDCVCEGPVYEMFRDLARDDRGRIWLAENHIRYDITRIPGRIICGEWIKTKGHYHPLSPDGTAYPEIYEVLEGEAIYLLQKRDLTDVILVEAKAGDIVMIPPGYGHVTINPVGKTLLMANLVSSEFSSEYIPYEEKRGAAYYLLEDGTISLNTHYKKGIPELRRICASYSSLPEPFPQKSLLSCIGELKSLRFLNEPGSYVSSFMRLPLFS